MLLILLGTYFSSSGNTFLFIYFAPSVPATKLFNIYFTDDRSVNLSCVKNEVNFFISGR